MPASAAEGAKQVSPKTPLNDSQISRPSSPEGLMGRAAQSLHRVMAGVKIPCEFVLPGGDCHRFGDGPPKFRVTIKTERALGHGFDEFGLGQAYVEGDIEIEGDMMSLLDLRSHLQHRRHWPTALKLWWLLLSHRPSRVNRNSIADHYDFGDDFYLAFIDKAYRFYSHCNFYSDDETVEQAAEHKLEIMYDALKLGPGKRLLDIGAGWGGVHEYCGPRGVHVTSVTLTEDSYNYTKQLIRRLGLSATCEVQKEDFLDHRPAKPYDGIVIYGVIEHIPYYRRFFQQVYDCLKPAGLFYLDASATKEMYDMSTFTRTYIWTGTHTFMCLQELIQELLFNGLDLLNLENDTHSYHLTMRHWATRFDENHDFIVKRWGAKVYRAFRVYLWGGCHALKNNSLQAYHLVAQKSSDRGPRPGRIPMTTAFIRNLLR
jgi:cyclopropane-fatty-acyl-phospholipid synthase